MKKKVFSLMTIVLFMSSSFGNSTEVVEKEMIICVQEEMSLCATIANFAGFFLH